MSVFEQVRQITALEAAERLGLKLKKNGSKHWACCPLHGEKTASLCIYGDGTWYRASSLRSVIRLMPCSAAMRSTVFSMSRPFPAR